MEKKDWFLITFIILNYCDFILTKYGLSTGKIYELNPLVNLNPLFMDMFKIGFVPLILILLHRRVKVNVYYLIVGVYTAMIIYSIVVLRQII